MRHSPVQSSPYQSVQFEAMLQLKVELRQSGVLEHLVLAMHNPGSKVWQDATIVEVRNLRDALNTFLSDMGAPLVVSDYLSVDGKLYSAAFVREAVAGYITPAPSASPVPTLDDGLEIAAQIVEGYSTDLRLVIARDIRARKGNSNSLPAPADASGEE